MEKPTEDEVRMVVCNMNLKRLKVELCDIQRVKTPSDSSSEILEKTPKSCKKRSMKSLVEEFGAEPRRSSRTAARSAGGYNMGERFKAIYSQQKSPQSAKSSKKNNQDVHKSSGRCKKRGAKRKEDDAVIEPHDSSSDEPVDEEDDDYSGCTVCSKKNKPSSILMCDGCDGYWHMACLRPPLMAVPEDQWFCPQCAHSMLVAALIKIKTEVEAELKRLCRKRRFGAITTSYGFNPNTTVLPPEFEETERPMRSLREKSRVNYNYNDFEKQIQAAIKANQKGDAGLLHDNSSNASANSDDRVFKSRRLRGVDPDAPSWDELEEISKNEYIENEQSNVSSDAGFEATNDERTASECSSFGDCESEEDSNFVVKFDTGKKKSRTHSRKFQHKHSPDVPQRASLKLKIRRDDSNNLKCILASPDLQTKENSLGNLINETSVENHIIAPINISRDAPRSLPSPSKVGKASRRREEWSGMTTLHSSQPVTACHSYCSQRSDQGQPEQQSKRFDESGIRSGSKSSHRERKPCKKYSEYSELTSSDEYISSGDVSSDERKNRVPRRAAACQARSRVGLLQFDTYSGESDSNTPPPIASREASSACQLAWTSDEATEGGDDSTVDG